MKFESKKWEYPKHLRDAQLATRKRERAEAKEQWMLKARFKIIRLLSWYILGMPALMTMQIDRDAYEVTTRRQAFYAKELRDFKAHLDAKHEAKWGSH